jgi:tetratricopeptide (TPR) repeat protein
MNPQLYFQLNQQYMQGCGLAQQALMQEMSGNWNPAYLVQMYEQAVGLITGSMNLAQQWGMPVYPQAWFALATVHFNAARIQAATGWLAPASQHLAQALMCLNQAIGMQPNFFQYHSAAGTVLLAQGNLPEAERAFRRALELFPGDVYSNYMLSVMQATQGNMAAAASHYGMAQQRVPNLPAPQQFQFQPAPPQGGPGGSAMKWLDIINKVATTVKNVGDAANTLSGLFGQGQSFAQPAWPGSMPTF